MPIWNALIRFSQLFIFIFFMAGPQSQSRSSHGGTVAISENCWLLTSVWADTVESSMTD